MRTVLGLYGGDEGRHHLLEPYLHLMDRRPRAIRKAMVDVSAAIASVHCMNLPTELRPSLDDLVRFSLCDARWPGAVDDIAGLGLAAAWATNRPCLKAALAHPEFRFLSHIKEDPVANPPTPGAKAFLISAGVVSPMAPSRLFS